MQAFLSPERNVRFRAIADIRARSDTVPMEARGALLKVGEGPQVQVADEHQLRSLLKPLCDLGDGEAATLDRGPGDFIKATRHGELWSVTAKRHRMWMAQSFTAAGTSDYSARRVGEARQHRSLRQRLLWWFLSPYPERALSTEQVLTLFAEYLSGRKFTLPFSGA